MTEIISIVNENDEVIWYKERWTLKQTDMHRVVWLWLENSKWEVLLAKRSKTKKTDPWLRWPAVTWWVRYQESYEQALKRETYEELWIEIKRYKEYKKIFIKNAFFQWYKWVVDLDISDFVLQKEEVDTVIWINKIELIKRLYDKPQDFVWEISAYLDICE